MTVVVGEEAEQEVFGRSVQRPEAAFYMDGGLLTYPHTEQLQEDLVILTGMFNRVRLSANVENMVGMTFQPCLMAVQHSESVYGNSMTGKYLSYWDRQR